MHLLVMRKGDYGGGQAISQLTRSTYFNELRNDGTDPSRRFSCNSRKRSLGRLASCAGILPTSWFSPSSKRVSFVNDPICVGIDPIRPQLSSFSTSRFVYEPITAGNPPFNRHSSHKNSTNDLDPEEKRSVGFPLSPLFSSYSTRVII